MSSPLAKSKALFVRRWGEMGGYWGINRTMAELHALLYLSGEPLCSDEIMEQLQISRGSASMNLRALLNWGLINRVHKRGDRKEYYVSETDVWQMFEAITRERKRREVEPIVETIQRCREMVAAAPAPAKGPAARETAIYLERLDNMATFLETMTSFFNFFIRLGNKGMRRTLKMLAKIESVV